MAKELARDGVLKEREGRVGAAILNNGHQCLGLKD